ncbi:MAG: hypothetical protein ABI220_00930 [Candidatus Saccharimonadales bacterium]
MIEFDPNTSQPNLEPQDPTALDIGILCRSLAEENQRYKDVLTPRWGNDTHWDAPDGVSYKIEFTVEHTQSTGREDNHDARYYIDLWVCYQTDKSMGDLREVTEGLIDVPGLDDEAVEIDNIFVEYHAYAELSSGDLLTWGEERAYEFEYFRTEPAGQAEGSSATIVRSGDEVLCLSLNEFIKEESVTPVDISEEDLAMRQSFDSIVDSQEAEIEAGYLRILASALHMYRTRDEGDFDLDIAFPRDIVEEIIARQRQD